MKCIREYKLSSILSPIFVSGEVVLECMIPFIIAKLVNAIDVETPALIDINVILLYGGLLPSGPDCGIP